MSCLTNWQIESAAKVLVVHDQERLRFLISDALESGGYEVVSTDNGADALEICSKSDPPIDLLVTDYTMPGMTGVALARECSRVNRELGVLYVSGSVPGTDLRADMQEQKRAFLAKPFRRAELLCAASDLLRAESRAALSPCGYSDARIRA